MKYWLFQNNQVIGPYDREQLAKSPGFSAESLVCSEGCKGTQMGDWQRAGVVAELADTLLKMSRVPAGAGGGEPGASLLPPEPTLRDLAVLGTLQEKVSLLENSLSQLQEDMQARDEEVVSLKVDLDQKGVEASALQTKVGDLEAKVAAAEALKEELAKTQRDQSQGAQAIDELKSQIDEVSADIRGSIKKLEESQAELRGGPRERKGPMGSSGLPIAAADAAPPRSVATPPALDGGDFGGEPPALTEPGLESEAQVVSPPFAQAPADLEAPPPLDLPTPEMAGAESPAIDAPPPFDIAAEPLGAHQGESIPNTLVGGTPTAPAEAEPFDAPISLDAGHPPAPGDVAAGAGDLVDLTAAPSGPVREKKPEKNSKKGLIAFLMLLLVAGGVWAAHQMGVLDPYLEMAGLVKPKPKEHPAPPAQLGRPAQPEPEPVVDPQQGLRDRADEAKRFVKDYPVPGTGKTLAMVIEAVHPPSGLLSPWNVKPLGLGSGRYQVNFYSKASGTPDYQFEVQLDARQVRGLTANSRAALNGQVSPPASARPARGASRQSRGRAVSRAKPERKANTTRKANTEESEGLLSDPLGNMLLDSSLARPSRPPRKRAAPKKPEPVSDETDLPPAREPEARKAGPKAPGKAAKPGKTKEELTLDELLLPGFGGSGG
ncbi:MAG: hypothetical protein ABII00_15155 [Elusimicrobiota bacterium]